MRFHRFYLIALLVSTAATAQTPNPLRKMSTQQFSVASLAPVLIVDSVEPSIKFWTEKLGFTKENVVPAPDGSLIFASVKKDGIEIMYQSKASVVADNPAFGAELNGRSASIFIMVPTVADLDEIERRTAGAPVVKARHDTFYGTTEFYIREPGGNVVGFSALKRETKSN